MATPTLPRDDARLAASDLAAAPLRVVACAGRSDRGTRRDVNEDAVLMAAPLLAVADGVGGNRAYLLRAGRLTQLTADHSLVSVLVANGELDVNAARTHAMQSVILRAVGLDARVLPDVTTVQARSHDVLLLCSDGLSDAVEPAELERVARSERDLDHLVERLADAAREAGSGDDVTIVAARLG